MVALCGENSTTISDGSQNKSPFLGFPYFSKASVFVEAYQEDTSCRAVLKTQKTRQGLPGFGPVPDRLGNK